MATTADVEGTVRVGAGAARIVAAGRTGALAALTAELDALLLDGLEGRVVGALTANCPRAPVKVHGRATVTGAELAALAPDPPRRDGALLTRRGRLGGAQRELLVVVAPSDGSGPGTLVAIERAGAPPDGSRADVVRALCVVLAAVYEGRASEGEPAHMTESLLVEHERARTIAELGEAHEAALTKILAALRSTALGDAGARRAATDVASGALIALREVDERDRAVSELAAADAFDRVRAELAALCRHAGVSLELAGPAGAPRVLPGELANIGRGVTRGIALTLLGLAGTDLHGAGAEPQGAPSGGASRLRVQWQVSADALTIVVRDDGDGGLDAAALDAHRIPDRVALLDGDVRLDSAAGWGTTVTATLPLAPLRAPDPGPLRALNAREREVLAGLVAGRRNRDIAASLSITVHTVKFHVANILRKLEVATRGEAAAVAREAG